MWNSQNKIVLKDLEYPAFIGVYEHEKKEKQTIFLDCVLYYNFEQACIQDTLEDTINYEEVLNCFQKVINSRHFLLIESLGYCLLNQLFDIFPLLESAELRLKKPNAIPQEKAYAAVELYQEREFKEKK